MTEQVEWRVMWEDDQGVWHNATDGAQSMFGLTNAEKLAKRLGPPWQVLHRATMLGPQEHVQELERIEAVSKAINDRESGPRFGSKWGV